MSSAITFSWTAGFLIEACLRAVNCSVLIVDWNFLIWTIILSFEKSTALVIVWLVSFALSVFMGSFSTNSTSYASCFSNFSILVSRVTESSANRVRSPSICFSFLGMYSSKSSCSNSDMFLYWCLTFMEDGLRIWRGW